MASNRCYDHINDDVLLSRGTYAFEREYKCWRPIREQSVSNEQFYSTDKISRVFHMNDYLEVHEGQTIVKRSISEDSHSSLPLGLEGIWFGIPGDRDQHTWYGNVACEIGIDEFLNTFKPKCYFAEIVEYQYKLATRLLLTTQDLPEGLDLPECDRTSQGGLWCIDDSGKHNFPSHIRHFQNGKGFFNTCEMEMFVILSGEECKRLYQLCDKFPTNHSSANEDGPNKCKKYRSGKRKEICKYDWSIKECNGHLENLRLGNIDFDMDSNDEHE